MKPRLRGGQGSNVDRVNPTNDDASSYDNDMSKKQHYESRFNQRYDD
jgi:hypothetical protein